MPPTARTILAELAELGGKLVLLDDRLRVRLPQAHRDRLGSLLDRIRHHEVELLELAKTVPPTDPPAVQDQPRTEPAEVQPTPKAPAFPTATDWITGRRITLEAVGVERYFNGGRPHTLRADLRQRWLTAYTDAMERMPEPQAWRQAWDAIRDGAA